MNKIELERAAGKVADLLEKDLEDLCSVLDELKARAAKELADRRDGARTYGRFDYRRAAMSDMASYAEQCRFADYELTRSPMRHPGEAWETWKVEHAGWQTMFQEPDTEFAAKFRSRRKRTKISTAANREFLRRQEAYEAAREEAVHA